MKTLFLTLIFLIISNITYSQFRIGTVRMADSTGTLTVSAPIKSWQSHWVKMKDLDSTIAGPGLKYTGSGLTLKIGPGLYISNDTLFVEGLSNKFFDIYFEGYLKVGNSLTSETVIKYDRSLFPKLVVDNVEPDDLEYGQVILWYDTEHLYWLINVDGKNWKVQLQ